MKTFKHEWILDAFCEHPTFFTRSMFGGLAAYVFERQMLLLVEPTKSGRWNWHGVLVCTEFKHHASIQGELPALMPHEFLRKWLFIDSSHAVRTGGDVVFEFLELLPRIPPGVWIHVHDIFFPFDYPPAWVIEQIYVRCLSRPPRPEEFSKLLAAVAAEKNQQQALEDVFWAVLNSREFMFNH